MAGCLDGLPPDGCYEWVVKDVLQLEEKQTSDTFKIGKCTWRLLCYPKQCSAPHDHLSLFLEYPAACTQPCRFCPKTHFSFMVVNHRDAKLHLTKGLAQTLRPEQVDWGFPLMMPLKDLTIKSGFLRADGALVIRLHLRVDNSRTIRLDLPGLSCDLLSLLDSPDGTSDLTITAGGRSFPAHRAILAARSEFFRGLFRSSAADSAARELPLPDTDPDALSLVLRCVYGDTPSCPARLLKPAAELADRWLLASTRDALYEHLVSTCDADTVIEDLLWAESRGAEELTAKLVAAYVECAEEVAEGQVEALVERSPRLLARLLTAVTKNGRNVRQRTQ